MMGKNPTRIGSIMIPTAGLENAKVDSSLARSIEKSVAIYTPRNQYVAPIEDEMIPSLDF